MFFLLSFEKFEVLKRRRENCNIYFCNTLTFFWCISVWHLTSWVMSLTFINIIFSFSLSVSESKFWFWLFGRICLYPCVWSLVSVHINVCCLTNLTNSETHWWSCVFTVWISIGWKNQPKEWVSEYISSKSKIFFWIWVWVREKIFRQKI